MSPNKRTRLAWLREARHNFQRAADALEAAAAGDEGSWALATEHQEAGWRAAIGAQNAQQREEFLGAQARPRSTCSEILPCK